MKNESSVKCVRDIRDIPPTAYRLPDDGRQQRHLCEQRQRLTWLLASYADADGTRAFPSTKTLAAAMGLSRRTVFYLLRDLTDKLGFLANGGYHGESGPRIRAINIEAMQGSGVQSSLEQECNLGGSGLQSTKAGVQSSTSGLQSSTSGLQSTIAPNRPSLTDQNRPTTQTDADFEWSVFLAFVEEKWTENSAMDVEE